MSDSPESDYQPRGQEVQLHVPGTVGQQADQHVRQRRLPQRSGRGGPALQPGGESGGDPAAAIEREEDVHGEVRSRFVWFLRQ